MITLHSVDLTMVKDPCFALNVDGDCRARSTPHAKCCTYKCPFYKPVSCKDWVRVEDRQGVNLIPPEEYRRKRMEKR